MSEKIINIQDAFLNYMRKNKTPVTIFLLNGVKLTGNISCFDQTSIVMKRDGYTQLIYKHAISTFSPHGSVSVFDWNGSTNTCERSKKSDEDEAEYIEEMIEEDDDEEEYEEVLK